MSTYNNQRFYAASAQCASLGMFIGPFCPVIILFIIFLLTYEKEEWVRAHVKEAINFYITQQIVSIALGIIFSLFFLVPYIATRTTNPVKFFMFFLPLMGHLIFWLLCSLVAAIRILRGKPHQYGWLSFRFLKEKTA